MTQGLQFCHDETQEHIRAWWSIKVMLFRCSYDVKLVSGLITVTVNAVTVRRLIRLFVSTVTFAVLVFMMTSASVQTTDWNRDVTIAVERCTIHKQTIDKTTSKWVSGGYYALPTRDRTVNALQTSQSTMPHSLMLTTLATYQFTLLLEQAVTKHCY